MRAKGHNAHLPAGRLRGKIHAAAEMRDPHAASRSLDDLLPLSASAATRVADALESHILYSFDRAETTPGRPLALDVFVTAGARDTERLVEKEYEVLDANGEALRGRKARRNLRQAAAAQHAVMEDEEFELV